MTNARFVRLPNGTIIPAPGQPVDESAPVEEVKVEEEDEEVRPAEEDEESDEDEMERTDIDDLLTINGDEDEMERVDTDDLTDLTPEDDDEIFGVSNEDVIEGYDPMRRRKKPSKKLMRRTSRLYRSPPTTLGGIR